MAHFLEQRVSAQSFLLIDAADGKSHVHDHVIAHIRLRDVSQARLPHDSAELDFAHAQPVRVVSIEKLAGNT